MQGVKRLYLSTRQLRKILSNCRKNGAKCITSKHSDKVNNNKFSYDIKQEIGPLIKEKLLDFAPTFACEKLVTTTLKTFG